MAMAAAMVMLTFEIGRVPARKPMVDGKLITSRQPSDLPAFMREIVRLLGKTPQ